MSTIDTIKNVVYAGVGLASVTTEKVKEVVDDLVEKGKISDTEGRRILDEVVKNTENTKEEVENKLKMLSDKISSSFEFLKKDNSQVNALKKRIEELEKELAAAKKSTTKTTARNTTTKSSTTKKTVAKKTTATAKKATTTSKATTKA